MLLSKKFISRTQTSQMGNKLLNQSRGLIDSITSKNCKQVKILMEVGKDARNHNKMLSK